MNRSVRIAALLAGVLTFSSVSSAYYHWIYFANRTGPFNPVAAKFDLNALPNKTVSYFVSEQGPEVLMPGDSMSAIVSQIRLAADTWDNVAESDLRLKFGGYGSATTSATPAVDVVFNDDMPPGVLALTYVVRPDDIGNPVNAGQMPILRSRIQLRRDLTLKQQASYSEKFFTTLVHEFGHSLGLQHTLTSSAMTTFVTRGTTKGKPLHADDIAGLAALYPTLEFPLSTASVSGRVALNGSGVNLASVVAISQSGVAVSGMTNPDGTYRIDGIPPGDYVLYVHPLPPAGSAETSPADIVPPVDTQNNPFPANTRFVTQFFPGTRDWAQAVNLPLRPGSSIGNLDFNVQASNGPALANMQTYGFYGPQNNQVAVPSPWLPAGRRSYLVFAADGALVNGNQLAPGLNVRILGSAAQIEPGSVQFYAPNFVLMIVNAPPAAATTPVALAVTTNTDLYVLPAAFFVASTAAPTVTGVNGFTDASGDAVVTVNGTGLNAGTKVLFDGAPGRTLEARADGSLSVAAPPASGAYRASVVAVNADGQTSAQALGAALPSAFTFAGPNNPTVSISPSQLTPGADMVLDITGFFMRFVENQVSIGFGTPDVVVKRIWIADRNHMYANIAVSPTATTGFVSLTLTTGLQTTQTKTTMQIVPSARFMTLRAPVLSVDTGMAGVAVGKTAIISGQGLPLSLSGWSLTIGGIASNYFVGAGGQIFATVPNLPPGPAIVRLAGPGGEQVPPIAMQVDSAPPTILSAAIAGTPIDLDHPAHGLDNVTLTVTGLADATGVVPAVSSLRVKVAGLSHAASSLQDLGGGNFQVTFALLPAVPVGSQVVSVGSGSRYSSGFAVAIR